MDESLAPVWEANHVWLIFCVVMLWTALPVAFAAITTTLYVPLGVAALGIVVRGAGFAFRQVMVRTDQQRVTGGRLRRLVGARAVLPRHRGRRDRVRPGPAVRQR
ncbi:cytochrome d ubiquinol oxidase subunit II [Amycolatopsis acidiphila]|uniref:cytochrome d ubiquinol oxidase subunit II n=1 Tax=Amycolatopsis acidiphila TaxID=715473 RepID=UPI0019C0C4C7|nr:cytochrome d ubiquinol oxidase subunit II [Amycolatopsis acidiphila]GHG99105.1 hypothetical protein GCM10017788_79520 [Amycolatopsis acidiphila]